MRNKRSALLAFLMAACSSCAVFAQAEDAPSPAPAGQATPHKFRHNFDPATGRDLLNYPSHRSADLLHERIELVIPDMNVPHAMAAATIRFTPIAGDVRTLVLQAAELNIRAVTSDGRTSTFTANPGDDRLEIAFDPPVPFGQTAEVRIDYEILNPPDGLAWTPESPQWPGRPASLHSQGQCELNRYWFPTHDSPNERLTSEVIVTVPPGYTASSNGRLVSNEHTMMPDQPDKPAEKFHFSQEREHAPYLVSLAVGKWDVVDVSTFGDRLPMPVYAPLGQGGRVKAVFGRTPKMISLYERLFSEPYPWNKYAQVVVTNFAWGGMENTSATTLYDTVVFDQTAALDGDEDALICHELAHQWFGDLMTCRTWEHIWLNEGWATYAEALWEQYKDSSVPSRSGGNPETTSPVAGLKADSDAYQFAVWNNLRAEIDADNADAPYQPGMASKQYAFPDEIFDRDANPYPKGSFALHMLRQRLTDPIFWRGVALYVSRHKGTPVETFDFRKCMEEVSGLSLQRFFDQWCFRPGVPHLKVTSAWNSEQRALTLSVEQTQTIDGPNPAFFFDLPVWIDDGSGKPRTVTVSSQTRSATLVVPMDREPRRIVIDPDMQVLAAVEFAQPASALIETLRNGPTLAARLNAVRSLASDSGDRGQGGIDALAAIVRDSKAFYGLRAEAARSLGRLANPAARDDVDEDHDPPAPPTTAASRLEALPALLKLAAGDISDARVRKAVAIHLGIAAETAAREDQKPAIAWLLRRWEKDPSYRVRAECLHSLGRLKAVDAIPALAKGLATDSQNDVIRIGAIDGLKLAAFPDALEQVSAMTAPNRTPPVRQAAIKAAGKLAASQVATSERDRVFNLLSALINDSEYRTRQAAVQTLLDLEDPRAVPTVEQWAAAARSRAERLWALDLLQQRAEEKSTPSAEHAATP
jgi:aminopeptidase N